MSWLTGGGKRMTFLLNLGQGLSLLAAITCGIGSGASFMSSRIDLQNLSVTTHDMVESLGDEIVIAAQLATAPQQATVLLPGGTVPPAAEPDPGIEEARRHLHNATALWSARDYAAMQKELVDGYGVLGAQVPLSLADNDLLTDRTKCLKPSLSLEPRSLDPVGNTSCLLKVPVQSYRLGLLSVLSGGLTALLAALSPPQVQAITKKG